MALTAGPSNEVSAVAAAKPEGPRRKKRRHQAAAAGIDGGEGQVVTDEAVPDPEEAQVMVLAVPAAAAGAEATRPDGVAPASAAKPARRTKRRVGTASLAGAN